MPSTIEQVHNEFKDRGLTILAVNIQESRDLVAKWVKGKGITSLVLFDPDGVVTSAYRVTGTLTAVLIRGPVDCLLPMNGAGLGG